MEKQRRIKKIAYSLLVFFILFTISLKSIDVRAIGPDHSKVGFATLNQACSSIIETNLFLYRITEILGIFPLMVMGYFALKGLRQLISRKKFLAVDSEIISMGILYSIMMVCYVLFEKLVINYRPVLLAGKLEASYPSSHTFLAITVLLSARYVFQKAAGRRQSAAGNFCVLWLVLIIVGRLFSGVHWVTDIFGGIVLGTAFALFYAAYGLNRKKER